MTSPWFVPSHSLPRATGYEIPSFTANPFRKTFNRERITVPNQHTLVQLLQLCAGTVTCPARLNIYNPRARSKAPQFNARWAASVGSREKSSTRPRILADPVYPCQGNLSETLFRVALGGRGASGRASAQPEGGAPSSSGSRRARRLRIGCLGQRTTSADRPSG